MRFIAWDYEVDHYHIFATDDFSDVGNWFKIYCPENMAVENHIIQAMEHLDAAFAEAEKLVPKT